MFNTANVMLLRGVLSRVLQGSLNVKAVLLFLATSSTLNFCSVDAMHRVSFRALDEASFITHSKVCVGEKKY